MKEFVDDLAVFTVADLGLRSCADEEGDNCPTPWDYCCVAPDVLAAHTLTVEITADGEIAQGTVKGQGGLDHLVPVVVSGTLSRDDAGNLAVRADSLHVGG